MTPLGRRQGELLAQLRDLLILPSSSSPPANNKLQSAVVPGPLSGAVGAARAGPPTGAAPLSTMSTGGRLHRRRGWSIKRGREDEVMTNVVEHHGKDPAAAARLRRDYYSCKRRKKKQQSGGTSSMHVTSAPDLFDGYQWRKYGQKQIQGAMYPRSYYRCTRSAEQGCAAKRTVQRNDDANDGGAAAAAPMYTVVRVGEHTCTANGDTAEAPVILETTAVSVVPASCTSNNSMAPTSSSAAAVASCSTTAAGTESPATSDNTLSLSSSRIASSDYYCYANDDCHGLLAAVHDYNDWVPALAVSSPSSLLTIEDFAGPIRSPVHISAPDGWTIDQLLLQLVNEPAICYQQII